MVNSPMVKPFRLAYLVGGGGEGANLSTLPFGFLFFSLADVSMKREMHFSKCSDYFLQAYSVQRIMSLY